MDTREGKGAGSGRHFGFGLVPAVGTRAVPGTAAPTPETTKAPSYQGFREERLKGLEPSTFCMASRRSSQLSYSRASGQV